MKNLLLALGMLFLATSFLSEDTKQKQAPAADAKGSQAAKSDDAAIIKEQKPSYPLTKCAISGEELGKDAVDVVKDGRLVRVCCNNCAKKVEPKHIEAINAAVIAAQKKDYPLNVCPISGEKLDESAQNVVHGTRLVRLCCGKCATAFQKDPKAYMAQLDKAYMEAQRKTYKLKTCLISDEELGSMGDPVEILYGTQLVRLCCKSCVKGFYKEPEKYLKKIADAK
ncbi:MAG: hypothetical protein ACKO32_13605 [Planctomycetia bacterium]